MEKKTKIWIGVGIGAILLGVGAYFLFRKKDEDNNEQNNSSTDKQTKEEGLASDIEVETRPAKESEKSEQKS